MSRSTWGGGRRSGAGGILERHMRHNASPGARQPAQRVPPSRSSKVIAATNGRVAGTSDASARRGLGSFLPALEIVTLLGGELVDALAHRLELESGHLPIY